MKLDPEVLRSRRLELGLSQRALARAARVSQPLINRLEETGNADRLECRTLERILEDLSLDLRSVVVLRTQITAPARAIRIHPQTVRLNTPSATDLRLLLLALRGELNTRRVALTTNGNVSLHRLRNARLVALRQDGSVVGTNAAALVFQTP